MGLFYSHDRGNALTNLPSGTPLDPKSTNKMNIDISGRKPGEKLLYTGPHLCVTCADENRVMNIYLKAGDIAPECKNCGTRAVWEP
jgi:hypothetical protein